MYFKHLWNANRNEDADGMQTSWHYHIHELFILFAEGIKPLEQYALATEHTVSVELHVLKVSAGNVL